MESVAEEFEFVLPSIQAVGTIALSIGILVKILYLAGVLSFKVTNRGVGK